MDNLFLNNMRDKIFEIWQFREKWDCLIHAVRIGSSTLKYWTGILLAGKAVDKNKDKFVIVAIKSLFSGRLCCTLKAITQQSFRTPSPSRGEWVQVGPGGRGDGQNGNS